MLVVLKDAINAKLQKLINDGAIVQIYKLERPPYTHTLIIEKGKREINILVAETAEPPVGIEVFFLNKDEKYVLPILEIWPEDEIFIINDLLEGVKNYFDGKYNTEKRGVLFFRNKYLNIKNLNDSLGSPVLAKSITE